MKEPLPPHIQIQHDIIDRCAELRVPAQIRLQISLSHEAHGAIMSCKQTELSRLFEGVPKMTSTWVHEDQRHHFILDESLAEGFIVSEFGPVQPAN